MSKLVPYQAPPLPMLPTRSGAVLGSARRLARKDAELIRAQTDKIDAEVKRTQAVGRLIDARLELVPRLVALHHIDEIAHHAYELGRADRAHALHMQSLRHTIEQQELVNQLIAVQAAGQPPAPQPVYAQGQPAPQPQAAPAQPGLSPGEVDAILAQLPDVPPEARATAARLLRAALAERRGS